ncbi:MAG: 2-oxo acid dehydrogenase subunit E2 [Deltaproteobacteria bacterium]|jgi:pyruvate dehydrogenase E2 component (dihydrolipoamide acetyltransferase)|nr:2-oxo acid dehydrogenase subunit E2 [Deltaproteobacteria bacterium]
MPKEFKLPDPGEGIHEAEIVEVLVAEGDRVEDGQLILVVETDKAATEIPSPVDGVVLSIPVKVGDVVKVGQVLMTFLEEGEEEAEAAAGKKEEGKVKKEKRKVEEKAAEEKKETRPKPDEGREEPVPAAPSTRRLARELGVDLRQVTPSGPQGQVTAEDVRAYSQSTAKEVKEEKAPEKEIEQPEVSRQVQIAPPPLPDFSSWGPIEKKPLRSIRRATANRMALAWSQIPHVIHEDVADVTELEEFRRKHQDEIEAEGGKLTLTMFILKAAVAALKEHPRFNASLDLEKGEIILKNYYHIGVAVATERGLIVPVVRDVDRKSITDLALELSELAERTRKGNVEREDLAGGTFTITNVGPLGGTSLSPIVNYPQVAILGLAQARLQPVVQGDLDNYRVVPRLMLPLCLGFDHRIADGADAAHFINGIIETLESPDKLMMHM